MIQLLQQDVINKIAAGEVVERPASVVKEITENAADAGASSIEIQLENGGISLIQITDNGVGMEEEDAKLCLLRHATSKLRSADDLFNIQSLGFRGEALASIASVSQFEILTKTAESPHAYKIFLDKNLQPSVEISAGNTGTRVTIKNLFYSVPARQKFLKTPTTELTHILRYLQNFALIHPEKELKLTHNGKQLFHYQISDWDQRVKAVLGQNFFDQLIPLLIDREGLQIKGFIAVPSLVHGTHKNQYLFVNERPVYDHMVNRSILEAYDTLVPRGYFPAFVLGMDIHPGEVDVNVHPRKSEVKFQNLSPIISALKHGVHQALQEGDLTQEKVLQEFGDIPLPQGWSASNHTKAIPSLAKQSSFAQFPEKRPSSSQIKQSLDFSASFSGSVREIKQSALEEFQWRIVGQIHLSFLLVETPEGLQLLDQHALSEITNYNRLMKEHENAEICSQQLLIPELIELSPEELNILEENNDIMQSLGWSIDQVDSGSVQIEALPEILKIENINENIHDILTQLKESKDLDMTTRQLQLLKYEACRGAVMFGDALTSQEMEALVNKWLTVPNNAACEHGRPASARISVDEMRRYFKR